MFYTVYQITNIQNAKIYIGTHITSNLDDDYMGSGIYLKRSMQKYGLDSFRKEILFQFANADDMFAKEAELVNAEFIKRLDTYNIMIGGNGGWDYVNNNNKGYKRVFTKEDRQKSFITNYANKTSIYSDVAKEKSKIGLIARNKARKNKWKHSTDTKSRMSLSHQGKHDAEKNSQFGTCWITNGTENRKIPKIDLENWIDKGYYKGRIFKK